MLKNIRLINARKNKGLTQSDLAFSLGYKGKQSVANWENGHSNPPLKAAIEISRILEADIEHLFGIKVQESHTETNSA